MDRNGWTPSQGPIWMWSGTNFCTDWSGSGDAWRCFGNQPINRWEWLSAEPKVNPSRATSSQHRWSGTFLAGSEPSIGWRQSVLDRAYVARRRCSRCRLWNHRRAMHCQRARLRRLTAWTMPSAWLQKASLPNQSRPWPETCGNVWWFGTFFLIYWEFHNPNWLSYFSEG